MNELNKNKKNMKAVFNQALSVLEWVKGVNVASGSRSDSELPNKLVLMLAFASQGYRIYHSLSAVLMCSTVFQLSKLLTTVPVSFLSFFISSFKLGSLSAVAMTQEASLMTLQF